ncbi:SDR family NAD(P)-dependent oxidoreductase [Conexibacter woesei]|uniref:Short-chain dehydrogenase/reductase SDR n=1 Tax=Conexibacter woesei (strain DSM 14684 / CCUG 47730 / CIP 108061 / JCM 11494 / NBRC 100937 / ID131577) TaxID=469383 RepID=D3FD85_CONWI|nr:SDR family NAD(P)-dependent oxidoreductase [Conexibacter woesei]ADB53477.1 short-chain dehydrogenase/reductase SDR [Conexibacter woesei DSM 14684]
MSIAADRKALVTGGAAGFGLDVARALRAAGARVAILDVDAARLERAAAELGGETVAVRADVRSPAEVGVAVAEVAERLGGLDTLVNSAGVIHVKPLADVTERDWDLTLDVNLKGTFLVCQAAAPLLRSSGRGRIVSISSDAGRRGAAQLLAYTASKFGVVGLTESLAAELAADQVTVNCVCPVGCPTTEMGKDLLDWKMSASGRTSDEVKASAARTNLVGRNLTEHDVTAAIMHFVSDGASFLTGVSLDVDGGARLGSIPGV